MSRVATFLEQRLELLNFVKACTEYHPDETPAWFLEDYGHRFNYGGEGGLEEFDADEAFDSYREDYGMCADTDTMRTICEGARQLLKDMGITEWSYSSIAGSNYLLPHSHADDGRI